jgi:hypothetical protein
MVKQRSLAFCQYTRYVFYIFTFTSTSQWYLVLWLVLRGVDHQFRADVLVEVGFADDLELEGGFLERETILVRVLGGFAGGIVANDGVEAGYEHETVHC